MHSFFHLWRPNRSAFASTLAEAPASTSPCTSAFVPDASLPPQVCEAPMPAYAFAVSSAVATPKNFSANLGLTVQY